jgi:hypothetical protein
MDWSEEHRYDVLIANPDVKRRILEAGAGVRAPVSREKSLRRSMYTVAGGDRLAASAGVAGVEFGYRLRAKAHLAVTRKERGERPWPVGETMVALLCSMAHNSLKVESVEQRDDGCEITAEIPSDRYAFAGVMTVTVSREPAGGSVISAVARNPGTLYDGGKARVTLVRLFSGIDRFAASWAAGLAG